MGILPFASRRLTCSSENAILFLGGTNRKMERTIAVSEELHAALQRQAARSRQPVEVLAEKWLNAHLDLGRYPEPEWRSGPGGWRVGIKGTAADVYTVAGYSQIGYSPHEIAEELLPRLTLEQIQAALCYYADYPDEIDQGLADNGPEATKARLFRSLGPSGYHRVTGAVLPPRVIREGGSDAEPYGSEG